MTRLLPALLAAVAALALAAPAAAQKYELPEDLPAAKPSSVMVPPATRRAINELLDRFVPAAVGRRDPALAWELAAPGLRAGTTRAEWLRGELPVFPFPFRRQSFHTWRAIAAEPDRVQLDLILHPRRGSGMGDISYAIDVVRRDGRWLVDAWYPIATWAPPQEKPFVTGPTDVAQNATTAKGVYEAEKVEVAMLDPRWLLIPAAIFASVVLIPLVLVVLSVRRSRRAEAAHRAFVAARAGSKS